jgi:hypothetical protein
MRKVFIIDGGAGRALCALPALERYVSLNPQQDVRILVWGWDSLYWGSPLLQPLTFNVNDKGVFQQHVAQAHEIVCPEPYRLPQYFRQEVNLVQAFDILINGTLSDVNKPQLYISPGEKSQAKKIIADCMRYQNNKQTLVLQPFGSSARFESCCGTDEVLDDTARSMNLLMFSKLTIALREHFNIILFADNKFHFAEDTKTYKLTADLRTHAAVIGQSDYFVGCDSVGQHMARAQHIPGTVILGSSFAANVCYPDWFHIVDKYAHEKIYSPLRINDMDCKLADRLNADCMTYTAQDIDDIVHKIRKHHAKRAHKAPVALTV